MSLPFATVDYDPAVHAAFVRNSWAKGTDAPGEPRSRLDELLSRPGSRCLVAHLAGRPDRFLGWAACTADAVIFAYTKDTSDGRLLRRKGLATALLAAMGVDVTLPTPLLIWTPSAQEASALGKVRIYHAPYRGYAPYPRERKGPPHDEGDRKAGVRR